MSFARPERRSPPAVTEAAQDQASGRTGKVRCWHPSNNNLAGVQPRLQTGNVLLPSSVTEEGTRQSDKSFTGGKPSGSIRATRSRPMRSYPPHGDNLPPPPGWWVGGEANEGFTPGEERGTKPPFVRSRPISPLRMKRSAGCCSTTRPSISAAAQPNSVRAEETGPRPDAGPHNSP